MKFDQLSLPWGVSGCQVVSAADVESQGPGFESAGGGIQLMAKLLIAQSLSPASILYKSIAGRYRPVSYPDEPITARYRFIKNAYWVIITPDIK